MAIGIKHQDVWNVNAVLLKVTVLIIAMAVGSLAQQAQPSLQIDAPLQGFLVNPGQSVTVSVSSPTGTAFVRAGVIAEDPIGISDIAATVPAQFSITVPAGVAAGRQFALTAFGVTASGDFVVSKPVTIDVQRADAALQLTASPSSVTLESLGQQQQVQIYATHADGSIVEVTESSNLLYTSSDFSIASISPHGSTGVVTAVAAGSASVTATLRQGGQNISLQIPITVLMPALTPFPVSRFFGGENGVNVGTSQSGTITLTNTTKSDGQLRVVRVKANGPDYSETDDCVTQSPLPVGGTCTIIVTFAPMMGGEKLGSILVSNNSTSALVIPLRGDANDNFHVFVDPGVQTVAAGASATYTISASLSQGFSGAIALNATGLPAGVSASFNPPSINTNGGSSTLTLTTPASIPLGDYTIAITGTNGATMLTPTVTLNVVMDFSLSASPISQTVTTGGSTSYSLSASAPNGFSDAIDLSVAGLPPGATVTIDPTFVTPPGSANLTVNTSASTPAGSYSLTVTGADGGLTHSVNLVVIVSPALAISLSPGSGQVGRQLTINGTGFGSTQGSSTVGFGGTSANPISWSDNSIVLTVPAGIPVGNADVVLTIPGSGSGLATFVVIPVILSFSPSSGVVGTTVTISGVGFGAHQGSSTLTFNDVPATITSWTDGSITAQVPAGTSSGLIVITINGIAANSVQFTVPTPPPSITSLTPIVGAIGSSVTIKGANFGDIQNGSVIFSKANHAATGAAVTSWGATSITVTVPGDAATGNVRVIVNGHLSNAITFTVQ